jgi:hypothetical protein
MALVGAEQCCTYTTVAGGRFSVKVELLQHELITNRLTLRNVCVDYCVRYPLLPRKVLVRVDEETSSEEPLAEVRLARVVRTEKGFDDEPNGFSRADSLRRYR